MITAPQGTRDGLPLKAAGHGPIDGITSQPGPPPGRLLIVDDSVASRHEMAARLEEDGYQTVVASSGQEALTILDGEAIDCILLDLARPSDGIDCVRRMKARADGCSIPIVMLTGEKGAETVLMGLGTGADDVLTKTEARDVLRARLNGHVRRRQVEEQNRQLREELQRARAEATQARAAAQFAAARAIQLGDLAATNRDLQRARDAAEEAVRIRDEFLVVASHELRTPLTSLLLQIHMLTKEPRDVTSSARKIESLDILKRQVEKLAGLVAALMDVSRISSGKLQLRPEVCDLVTIAREVIKRYDGVARAAGCRMVFLGEGPIEGFWDSTRLEQVITNLISNALKFGAGKPIEISVSRGPRTVTLTVRDHGIGIAPDKIDRIFNRFERAVTSENHGGLGLGLFISRSIAEAHAGQMRASSTPGQGAQLILDLPLASLPR